VIGRDVDWKRAMKTSFTGEVLKDSVVNVGVWAFTLLWIFPVTLFVGASNSHTAKFRGRSLRLTHAWLLIQLFRSCFDRQPLAIGAGTGAFHI